MWAIEAIRECAATGGADLIMLPELGLSCPSAKEEAELVQAVQHIANEFDVIVALAIGVAQLETDIPLFDGLGLLVNPNALFNPTIILLFVIHISSAVRMHR